MSADSTNDDDFPFDYDTSRIVFILCASLFLFVSAIVFLYAVILLSDPLNLHGRWVSHYGSIVYLSGVLLALLLITSAGLGCVLLAKYTAQTKISQKFDYYGPVRIKGYTIVFDIVAHGKHVGSDAIEYKHDYVPKMTVEFGYAWACPDDETVC